MSYAAINHYRTAWANYQPVFKIDPVPDYIREAFALVDPVVISWREANPRSDTPRWYREIEAFANTNHGRVWTCCTLFVQQAEGVTGTAALLHIARAAIKMAGCNHEHGVWCGRVATIAGEYDDDLIFSCPDCGYKGA